jgi:hypothetical protein
MYTAGPLNLRPFLESEWYSKGGALNLSLHINFTCYPLLFMPLGQHTELAPGDAVPPYLGLLSKKRFLYRAHQLRKEADKFIRHPRFMEIAMAMMPSRLERVRTTAIRWRESPNVQIQGLPMAIQDCPGAGIGGSSFGSV